MEELKKFQWLVAQFLCYYNKYQVPEKLDLFRRYIESHIKEHAEIDNTFSVYSVEYNEDIILALTNEKISDYFVFKSLLNAFIYDVFKLYTDDILDEYLLDDLFKFFTKKDLELADDGLLFADLLELNYTRIYKPSNIKRKDPYPYLINHPIDENNTPNVCVRNVSAYEYACANSEDKEIIYFIIPKTD